MFKYSVVLAGGKGTRFNLHTVDRPKAMVKVKNLPLVSYSLAQISSIENIIMTVGPFKEMLMDYSSKVHNVNSYVLTTDKEDCWWLFNSFLKNIDSPCLVLPCDLVVKIDLDFLFDEFVALGSPPIMLVPIFSNEISEGDFIKTEYGVFKGVSRLEKGDLFNTGIQVINPHKINKLLDGRSEFYSFNKLWNYFANSDNLLISNIYPHNWFSINSESELNYYFENLSNYYSE